MLADGENAPLSSLIFYLPPMSGTRNYATTLTTPMLLSMQEVYLANVKRETANVNNILAFAVSLFTKNIVVYFSLIPREICLSSFLSSSGASAAALAYIEP